jgi:hypothetical protein
MGWVVGWYGRVCRDVTGRRAQAGDWPISLSLLHTQDKKTVKVIDDKPVSQARIDRMLSEDEDDEEEEEEDEEDEGACLRQCVCVCVSLCVNALCVSCVRIGGAWWVAMGGVGSGWVALNHEASIHYTLTHTDYRGSDHESDSGGSGGDESDDSDSGAEMVEESDLEEMTGRKKEKKAKGKAKKVFKKRGGEWRGLWIALVGGWDCGGLVWSLIGRGSSWSWSLHPCTVNDCTQTNHQAKAGSDDDDDDDDDSDGSGGKKRKRGGKGKGKAKRKKVRSVASWW